MNGHKLTLELSGLIAGIIEILKETDVDEVEASQIHCVPVNEKLISEVKVEIRLTRKKESK